MSLDPIHHDRDLVSVYPRIEPAYVCLVTGRSDSINDFENIVITRWNSGCLSYGASAVFVLDMHESA